MQSEGARAERPSSSPPAEVPLAHTEGALTPMAWGFTLPPLPAGAGFNELFHPDRGRETLLALGRLRMAAATAAFASAMSTVVGFMALYILLTPGAGPGILDVPPALGLLLVAWLAQIVAVALGWSAFQEVADAAPGISREHTEAARRAVRFVYLATAAWIIGGLAGFAVTGAYFLEGVGNLPTGHIPRAAIVSISVSFALTGIAVNALVAVAMQALLSRLLTRRGQRLRNRFYQLAMGGTAASVAVSVACVAVLGSIDVHGVVASVSVASLVVYLAQIREAERGTGAMARARGTDPDAP